MIKSKLAILLILSLSVLAEDQKPNLEALMKVLGNTSIDGSESKIDTMIQKINLDDLQKKVNSGGEDQADAVNAIMNNTVRKQKFVEPRDPFAISNKIVNSKIGVGAIATRFSAAGGGGMPKIKLEAIIRKSENDSAAVIRIQDSSAYTVRKGDRIGLYEFGSNQFLYVNKVGRNSVIIRIGEDNNIKVIR